MDQEGHSEQKEGAVQAASAVSLQPEEAIRAGSSVDRVQASPDSAAGQGEPEKLLQPDEEVVEVKEEEVRAGEGQPRAKEGRLRSPRANALCLCVWSCVLCSRAKGHPPPFLPSACLH